MANGSLIRLSPSGPLVKYPAAFVNWILTVQSDGTVEPQPGGGGPPAPTISHLIFIAPFGSDTTGDGTMSNPYRTIAKAYSVITTASLTETWTIVAFAGTYSEDVALRPFIEIVGWDYSQTFNDLYPARLDGMLTLSAQFSASGAKAWMTGFDLSSSVTLDFDAVAALNGQVFFTSSQFDAEVSATMNSDTIEFHNCTFFDAVTQSGGKSLWQLCTGAESAALLHVRARTGSGAQFDAYNSTWIGDVHADQNGNGTLGQVVTMNLHNCDMRSGTLTLTAVAANVPTVDAEYGSLPENPVLAGSSAVALSRQMRISHRLEVPVDTNLAPVVTNVNIPLVSTIIGATSIEEMNCNITPIGDDWGAIIADGETSWSWYVRQNGTTSEVHIVFFNTTETTIELPRALPFLFYAFAPNVIAT
jgi:hypothetical protein